MSNKDEMEDIYLQKKLLEAAAEMKVDINDQKTLDLLLYIARQCVPGMCKSIITEYKNNQN